MSNFVQNYKIKVERQLVSIIVGVVVCVIIYVFNQIVEHSSKPSGKTAPKPTPMRPTPQFVPIEHPMQAPKPRKVAKKQKKTTPDMPGDCTVATTKTIHSVQAQHNVKPTTPETGGMTLRQAVLWSEILKRKF